MPTPIPTTRHASTNNESEGFGDADYLAFQRHIQAKVGIRLADYKPEQMRRRIGTIADRAGFKSFQEYFTAMDKNQELLNGFLDKMTINVSELLRNPPRFDDLFLKVFPSVLRDRGADKPIAIWSAGCSYGAEAYSLALLLHDQHPRLQYSILGTDIDREVLEKAKSGHFTVADMNNVSELRRQKYFSAAANGTYDVKNNLRDKVTFSKHDLLADPYPSDTYDLIVCRNVVIYFTDAAKERIYRNFYAALKPGGVLFVGGTERLPDHRAIGFDLVMPFFYRKPLSA